MTKLNLKNVHLYKSLIIDCIKQLFLQISLTLVLAEQVAQLQHALTDVTERHAREKKRRQELHNALMVGIQHLKSNVLKTHFFHSNLFYY